MKPVEVNKQNEKSLFKAVYDEPYKSVKLKFKVGDKVRISKSKGLFVKGYTPNWYTEVFEIYEFIFPPTYRIQDLKCEATPIVGVFYEPELLKVKYSDVYLVEKVLKKKGDKGFVKWLGFYNSHSSWINKMDVEQI
jgi:hypothetical protein